LNFHRLSDYSSRLHDYYFKELRSHPHRASALYQNKTKWPCPIFVFNCPGIAPELLVSLIRECKGRKLFRIRKIYFKKDQNTFAKPQKPPCQSPQNRLPSLAEWCKDRTNSNTPQLINTNKITQP